MSVPDPEGSCLLSPPSFELSFTEDGFRSGVFLGDFGLFSRPFDFFRDLNFLGDIVLLSG